MSADYSFVETFVTKVNDPDIFDYVGSPIAGVDGLFTELGKIAKSIQDKTFTAADAQAAKAMLQNFSDGIGRLNARIAQDGSAVGNGASGSGLVFQRCLFPISNSGWFGLQAKRQRLCIA